MKPYRERLSPGWWMVLAVGLVFPATILIFLPLSIAVGVAAGATLWAGSVAVLWFFSPVITVSGGVLKVGNAQIDLSYIGPVEAFQGEAARHEKGPGASGLAWLSLRPWVDPVVKITVVDSADPTPYWLISTRRPEELRTALEQN